MEGPHDALIDAAASVLHRRRVRGRLLGDVGAAVEDDAGVVHLGVCLDTPTWGICAERSALAAMVTSGRLRVRRVVAVWRDEHEGPLHVLPPCGHCRQLLLDLGEDNLGAEVVLGRHRTVALRDLVPLHAWPEPLD